MLLPCTWHRLPAVEVVGGLIFELHQEGLGRGGLCLDPGTILQRWGVITFFLKTEKHLRLFRKIRKYFGFSENISDFPKLFRIFPE